MEIPNRKIGEKYYFVDDNNNIIREATQEEISALKSSLILDAKEIARKPLTETEVLRLFVSAQINNIDVDDNTSLRMKTYYPEWKEGTPYSKGYKVQFEGRLWTVVQDHTSQLGWQPTTAPSLWREINEVCSGELTDPIPYNGNMALESGKYYVQDNKIYLCNRDTINPVYNTLSELKDLYVTIV